MKNTTFNNTQPKVKDIKIVTIRKGMHRVEFKWLIDCPITGFKSYCTDVETFTSKKDAELFRYNLLIQN